MLYRGDIGAMREEARRFSAELRSAKAAARCRSGAAHQPDLPRDFCGPGCTLSAARFTHEARLTAVDFDGERRSVRRRPSPALMLDGSLRWIDGPQAGLDDASDRSATALGCCSTSHSIRRWHPARRALLREGCDHTLATCAARFANAANFQGEPFLPGNDLLARYPTASREWRSGARLRAPREALVGRAFGCTGAIRRPGSIASGSWRRRWPPLGVSSRRRPVTRLRNSDIAGRSPSHRKQVCAQRTVRSVPATCCWSSSGPAQHHLRDRCQR